MSQNHAHRVALTQPINPTPLCRPLFEFEVDGHRSLDCREYDGCLHAAVIAGWPGWSCAKCPRHVFEGEAPEINPDEYGRTNCCGGGLAW